MSDRISAPPIPCRPRAGGDPVSLIKVAGSPPPTTPSGAGSARGRQVLLRHALGLLGALLFLFAWELAARLIWRDPQVLPAFDLVDPGGAGRNDGVVDRV